MSTSELTAVAAGIAFAAVVLLVLIDPRKPSRRPAGIVRGRRKPGAPSMEPAAVPAVLYRKPRWHQRLFAIGGMGAVALIIGFFVALAFAVVLVGSFVFLREAVG